MIIKNLEDKIVQCYLDNLAQYSDFLTIEEISQADCLLRDTGLYYEFWGGYEGAERKLVMFSPEESISEYPYVILCGKWDKFSQISHRDVLGAVMASGIERRCIGDILFDEKERKFYLFVLSRMADYICCNVEQIGRGSVVWSILSDIPSHFKKSTQEGKFSVSSLRIDAVIATVFCLSRQKAQDLVAAKKVYIDHVLVTKPTQNIRRGNSVVVKGCGKFIFLQEKGFSKKGKLYILIKQYM